MSTDIFILALINILGDLKQKNLIVVVLCVVVPKLYSYSYSYSTAWRMGMGMGGHSPHLGPWCPGQTIPHPILRHCASPRTMLNVDSTTTTPASSAPTSPSPPLPHAADDAVAPSPSRRGRCARRRHSSPVLSLLPLPPQLRPRPPQL